MLGIQFIDTKNDFMFEIEFDRVIIVNFGTLFSEHCDKNRDKNMREK